MNKIGSAKQKNNNNNNSAHLKRTADKFSQF